MVKFYKNRVSFSYYFHFYSFIYLFRNPNNDTSSLEFKSYPEWKAYTLNEHNYIFFQLNNIHNEPNYFDSMYNFWLKSFQTELIGGCSRKLLMMKMKKHIAPFLIILFVLFIILILYFLCKRHHQKEQYRTQNDLLQYPNFITT